MAKKTNSHATKSFNEYVADAQSKAMEKIIEQKVSIASQAILQTTYKLLIQERAAMQTRQLAFERLLSQNTTWFNEELLAMAVADVEDESAGLETITTRNIEVGDKVRIELWLKTQDAQEFSTGNKLAIHAVGVKNPNGDTYQTHEALENQLLGMATDETKEFDFQESPAEGDKPANISRVKVLIKKISALKAKGAVA